ncbi:MAG TPA: oxidoreductase, partial [Polyangia bacterium]
MNDQALYPIRRREVRGAGAPLARPWRSLRELEGGGRPLRDARREFPPAGAPAGALDRRGFVQLAGAVVGGAASAGCAAEVPRKILPYTRPPVEVTPGVSSFYATSMVVDGYASGLLVQSREGRPIKIEGNPEHPASLGATTMAQQASIRQLYDDSRGRRVRSGTSPSSWEDLLGLLRGPRTDRGARLRILMEPTGSPTLLGLLDRIRRRFPRMRAAFHSAIPRTAAAAGAEMAFGRPLLPQYDFSRAGAIVSFDADFLCEMPFSVRYARQWAERRRMRRATDEPNRLYVVESQLSVTGSMADDRLRRRLSAIPAAALALARALGLPPRLLAGAPAGPSGGELDAWARAVARDLRSRPRGTTLVMAGER